MVWLLGGSCPCTALPSFSPPQALFCPRAFARLFPRPRMLGPGRFPGSPSPCRDVSGSTVSLERTVCSLCVSRSFLAAATLPSALFYFVAATTSDICVYLLLPPVESLLRRNGTWLCSLCLDQAWHISVMLRGAANGNCSMENASSESKTVPVPTSQVGLGEAVELPRLAADTGRA